MLNEKKNQEVFKLKTTVVYDKKLMLLGSVIKINECKFFMHKINKMNLRNLIF